MSEPQPMVRALYRACAIEVADPPYDRLIAKIYYPAAYTDSAEERNSGVIPARLSDSKFPVVVLFPGINVDPESYSWLAESLCDANMVAITYSFVSEEMPGYVNLSPGLDMQALAPEVYGLKPSARCLSAILSELHSVNQSGVLANKLDLNTIIIGGHSAGGSVALYNANKAWFRGLTACFSYAAHAGAATMLGWPEQSVMSLPADVPFLLMGGDQDGVIASSAHRYGVATGHPSAMIERTFREGLSRSAGDSYLAIIAGANHFSFAQPKSDCTGRPFLDQPEQTDNIEIRNTISHLLRYFIQASLGDAQAAEKMAQQNSNKAFSLFESR